MRSCNMPISSARDRLVAGCAGIRPKSVETSERLSEAEDVVDEEEHVLVLNIAEVLCDRQPCEGDT